MLDEKIDVELTKEELEELLSDLPSLLEELRLESYRKGS